MRDERSGVIRMGERRVHVTYRWREGEEDRGRDRGKSTQGGRQGERDMVE